MYVKESRESADREIDIQAWHIEKRTPHGVSPVLVYITIIFSLHNK